MKKIIATVLAMVMAMALCVTAFAAVKYTAYDKTGKEIAKDVTYETCKATYDKKTCAACAPLYCIRYPPHPQQVFSNSFAKKEEAADFCGIFYCEKCCTAPCKPAFCRRGGTLRV